QHPVAVDAGATTRVAPRHAGVASSPPRASLPRFELQLRHDVQRLGSLARDVCGQLVGRVDRHRPAEWTARRQRRPRLAVAVPHAAAPAGGVEGFRRWTSWSFDRRLDLPLNKMTPSDYP